jgi:hypothetical protein
VSECSPTDVAQIEAILRRLERGWRDLDFSAIESLWDRSRPPIYFAEEAAQPLLSWSALRDYWRQTAGAIERMGLSIALPATLRMLAAAPGTALLSAIYTMHWDALIRGSPRPVGGDNRVCATFRQVQDEWKLTQYVEAPLAPIVYMRKLYESSVSPDFDR